MVFEDIIGNSKTKQQLIHSVKNNRVAHAQLFLGKEGSAKLALALAYSQFLNCENRLEEDSCGKCSSCLKHNNLTHPDLHLIFPVLKTAKQKRAISDTFINEWRKKVVMNPYLSLNHWIDSFGVENKTGQEGLIYKDEAANIHEKLKLKNYEAKYKVVLIWMPERMNKECSNKLLKILEEPPLQTIFLAVSSDTSKILNTITSRLQIVRISNFTDQEIEEHCKAKNIKTELEADLTRLSDANLGQIIEMNDQDLDTNNFFEVFSKWLRLVYKVDIYRISKWGEEISTKGRKHQVLFLSYAIKIIRECLIYNFASKELLKTNKKEREFISNFALFIHEENSILIIEKIEESIRLIRRNANAKILFFELSLQMVKYLKLKQKFTIN